MSAAGAAPPVAPCPMRECRRSIALGDLPAFPERPPRAPCLHFIAAWGPRRDRSRLAEEVLAALDGNREFVIRSLRPQEVEPRALSELRTELDAAARRFAHAVDVRGSAGDPGETTSGTSSPGWGALFGDPYERDAVAREFARLLIGVPADRGSDR